MRVNGNAAPGGSARRSLDREDIGYVALQPAIDLIGRHQQHRHRLSLYRLDNAVGRARSSAALLKGESQKEILEAELRRAAAYALYQEQDPRFGQDEQSPDSIQIQQLLLSCRFTQPSSWGGSPFLL
jgi:hypothetical protein